MPVCSTCGYDNTAGRGQGNLTDSVRRIEVELAKEIYSPAERVALSQQITDLILLKTQDSREKRKHAKTRKRRLVKETIDRREKSRIRRMPTTNYVSDEAAALIRAKFPEVVKAPTKKQIAEQQEADARAKFLGEDKVEN